MKKIISYKAGWFDSYTGRVAHLEARLKVINIPYIREVLLNRFLDKLKREAESRGMKVATLDVYDEGGLFTKSYYIIVNAVPTNSLLLRITSRTSLIAPVIVELLIFIVRIVVIALFIKFLVDYVVVRAFAWWKSLPEEERSKITGALFYGTILIGSALLISGIARVVGIIYGKPSKA